LRCYQEFLPVVSLCHCLPSQELFPSLSGSTDQ
jgi:hypothetical protein